jgi:hypothetical protein
MFRPQFSLKSLLWWTAMLAVFLAQFSTLDRIWASFASNELPLGRILWLLVIWIVGLNLLARR